MVTHQSGRRLRSRLGPFLQYVLVIAIVLVFSFPILWMLMMSFKTQVQNLTFPPLIVFTPTLENYQNAFVQNPFLKFSINSFVVATGSTLLGLLVGAPMAYAVAHFKRQDIAFFILLARILPGISYLVPWFIIFNTLQMVGSYLALVLTHLTVGLPIITWMLIGAFEDVPSELEDAALIDGCGVFTTFRRIALPLTTPVMISASIIAFIFSWNNFLFSLIIAGPDTQPLPVAIFQFLSYMNINWGGLAAAATLVTTPTMIITLIAQRYIVSGFTLGAVKG